VDPQQVDATGAEPSAVGVSDDGSRVTYVRGGQLWLLDLATGTERAVATPVAQYDTDARCRTAAYVSGGRLFRMSLGEGLAEPGAAVELPVTGPVRDPRVDPTGRRVAYLHDGELRVIDEYGTDHLLAGEDGIVWGAADPATAEVFGRDRGYWWSPDGERLLATRVDPAGTRPSLGVSAAPSAGVAVTSLHLLDLDGFWVDVRWDRQAYPHLVAVTWQRPGGPLIAVLPRSQHHALVLAVDARTGETQVHAELDDPRWVAVTPGTPAYLPDGRVVLGGELSLDAVDTRCLFADGTLLTPATLYVHRLAGMLAVDEGPDSRPGPATLADQHTVDLIVEASEAEPSERHVYRVRLVAKSSHPEVARLTTEPGWHTAHGSGTTLVIASESLEHAGVRATAYRSGAERQIPSYPADGLPVPRPALSRVTDRRLPCGVLYPSDHVAGRRLPVLVAVQGGPGRQGVVAARARWKPLQWYAEQGFAVVVIDPRGTPGNSPSFEKAIYRRVTDVLLTDHTEGLVAIAAKHPDLDLERVAILGAGIGGSVAVAAVLRHPEVFHAAVADSPIVDWHALPVAYAERLLGPADDNPEVYARHDLVAEATETGAGARPLLLVNRGVGGQTARLGEALRDAGHRCEMFSGPDATNDHLVGFIRRSLGGGP